jgi:hypothetical protein
MSDNHESTSSFEERHPFPISELLDDLSDNKGMATTHLQKPEDPNAPNPYVVYRPRELSGGNFPPRTGRNVSQTPVGILRTGEAKVDAYVLVELTEYGGQFPEGYGNRTLVLSKVANKFDEPARLIGVVNANEMIVGRENSTAYDPTTSRKQFGIQVLPHGEVKVTHYGASETAVIIPEGSEMTASAESPVPQETEASTVAISGLVDAAATRTRRPGINAFTESTQLWSFDNDHALAVIHSVHG